MIKKELRIVYKNVGRNSLARLSKEQSIIEPYRLAYHINLVPKTKLVIVFNLSRSPCNVRKEMSPALNSASSSALSSNSCTAYIKTISSNSTTAYIIELFLQIRPRKHFFKLDHGLHYRTISSNSTAAYIRNISSNSTTAYIRTISSNSTAAYIRTISSKSTFDTGTEKR